MASIKIGGIDYLIPEMNFLAIERAWPFVVEATESLDPMKGPAAALAVFAAAIMEGEDFDPSAFGVPEESTDTQTHTMITHFFKKNLKGTEISVVKETMFDVLKEAGLEVTEGEAIAALTAALGPEEEEPIPSPETAPDTSQNLSQPELREAAGTP